MKTRVLVAGIALMFALPLQAQERPRGPRGHQVVLRERLAVVARPRHEIRLLVVMGHEPDPLPAAASSRHLPAPPSSARAPGGGGAVRGHGEGSVFIRRSARGDAAMTSGPDAAAPWTKRAPGPTR